MKHFAELCGILESSRKSREKVAALVSYFQDAPPDDAMWAIRLLLGWKPRRVATSRELREWARDIIEIPDWLFEESQKTVGDLLETLTLICPLPENPTDEPLEAWIRQRLLPLQERNHEERKTAVLSDWQQMNAQQRFIWNKLLTGGFRPHVSEKTLVKALSVWRGLPKTVLACRLKNDWEPTVAAYRALFSHDIESLDSSRPYPFHQHIVLEERVDTLGRRDARHASWHWKGIRAQIVKRDCEIFIWSEEQALLNDAFPELCAAMAAFPDGTVFDGTIVAWNHDAPLNVTELERRRKRKRVTKQLMQEIPVRYWVDDLLEEQGHDIRGRDFCRRHERVQALMPNDAESPIQASTDVTAASWETLDSLRNDARQQGADGLLLKRLTRSEQQPGPWWVWRSDSLTVTAVLLYVQRLSASTGNRTLEGTFGVWNGEDLVPVAKAASGFTDEDVYEIELFAKEHTIDRFGPVRSLTPELVFTIAFDDVYPSSRHKSGLIVHNPRIAGRERKQSIREADTLETVQNFIV